MEQRTYVIHNKENARKLEKIIQWTTCKPTRRAAPCKSLNLWVIFSFTKANPPSSFVCISCRKHRSKHWPHFDLKCGSVFLWEEQFLANPILDPNISGTRGLHNSHGIAWNHHWIWQKKKTHSPFQDRRLDSTFSFSACVLSCVGRRYIRSRKPQAGHSRLPLMNPAKVGQMQQSGQPLFRFVSSKAQRIRFSRSWNRAQQQ